MNLIYIYSYFIISLFINNNKYLTNKIVVNQQIPEIKKLMDCYPQIVKYNENKLFFVDGSFINYDDYKDKNINQLLSKPSIKDQFKFQYQLGKIRGKIKNNFDPGRIRNEEFFKKIYGKTKIDVEKNLVEVTWCPKLVGKKIKITKVNGVSEKIKQVSLELDRHPELKKYLTNIGGTFNWRYIKGTNRLSNHSFGITIDINIDYSNYWQWDCNCQNEFVELKYKNRIPQEIVDVFEKYGFIWGGKWYHYDTMHFEYRPELI